MSAVKVQSGQMDQGLAGRVGRRGWRRKNRAAGARMLLEGLEPRQLLSAAVHPLDPHYLLLDPAPSPAFWDGPRYVILANIDGLPEGLKQQDLHATVTWDKGHKKFDVVVSPGDFGQAQIMFIGGLGPAMVLPDTAGAHVAHVRFWRTDASGKKLDKLSFDAPAYADQHTANGVTIKAVAGEQFNGKIGLRTPTDPSAGESDAVTTRWVIDWGDGTQTGDAEVFNGDGTTDVVGQHTYQNPGNYRILMVEIFYRDAAATDVGGSFALIESLAIVSGPGGEVPPEAPEVPGAPDAPAPPESEAPAPPVSEAPAPIAAPTPAPQDGPVVQDAPTAAPVAAATAKVEDSTALSIGPVVAVRDSARMAVLVPGMSDSGDAGVHARFVFVAGRHALALVARAQDAGVSVAVDEVEGGAGG